MPIIERNFEKWMKGLIKATLIDETFLFHAIMIIDSGHAIINTLIAILKIRLRANFR